MFVNKNFLFRAWFYFRTGWGTYFAFLFAAINTLTVTYYLAIERYPALYQLFPSFSAYVIIIMAIGVPILVLAGYAHFKKSGAFRSEADIGMETNPYFRRMLINTEIVIPLQLKLVEIVVKLSKNENLTNEELDQVNNIKDDLYKHMKRVTKGERLQFEDGAFKRLKDMDKEKSN